MKAMRTQHFVKVRLDVKTSDDCIGVLWFSQTTFNFQLKLLTSTSVFQIGSGSGDNIKYQHSSKPRRYVQLENSLDLSNSIKTKRFYMISITEAVKTAQYKLSELIPQATGILLEEVELVKTEYHITLSFPESSSSLLHSQFQAPRKYKLLSIDANTGEFKSMKIRNV